MSNVKKGIVVCLLAAVLLVSMVGMASAAQVTYFLDSDKDTDGSEQYIMWKGSISECNDDVVIGEGGSEIWTANEPAACDVGFSDEKSWGGRIARSDEGEKKFTAYIGYYDGTSFYSAGNSAEITIPDGAYHGDFSITTSAFTVPEGKWLALKVASSTGVIVIYQRTVGADSYNSVVYFDEPPDYPYPELNTLVLLGVGLLTLVGYVTYRRRNDKK